MHHLDNLLGSRDAAFSTLWPFEGLAACGGLQRGHADDLLLAIAHHAPRHGRARGHQGATMSMIMSAVSKPTQANKESLLNIRASVVTCAILAA